MLELRQLQDQRSALDSELTRANALLRGLNEGGSSSATNDSGINSWQVTHIDRTRLAVGRQLGAGNFGVVFEARLSDSRSQGTCDQSDHSDTIVAVKELRRGAAVDQELSFLAECRLVAALRHDRLVQMLGICIDTQPYLLVLEYMPGGDLRRQLLSFRGVVVDASQAGSANDGSAAPDPPAVALDATTAFPRASSVSPLDIWAVATQVADAMSFLESRRIVHRDLACRNVLVGSGGLRDVKLSDYGLSRLLNVDRDYYRAMSQTQLPVRWMAPESIQDRVWTTHSDVWSFAVLVWETGALGRTPFGALSTPEVVRAVTTARMPERPALCTPALYALLQRCWQRSPEARPSFTELHALLSTGSTGVAAGDAASRSNKHSFELEQWTRQQNGGRSAHGAWALRRASGAVAAAPAASSYEYDVLGETPKPAPEAHVANPAVLQLRPSHAVHSDEADTEFAEGEETHL